MIEKNHHSIMLQRKKLDILIRKIIFCVLRYTEKTFKAKLHSALVKIAPCTAFLQCFAVSFKRICGKN